MYPEMVLVFMKDRKIVTAEAKKEGKFTEVTIDVILVGEYVRVHKFMKYVTYKLYIWRYIGNIVGV